MIDFGLVRFRVWRWWRRAWPRIPGAVRLVEAPDRELTPLERVIVSLRDDLDAARTWEAAVRPVLDAAQVVVSRPFPGIRSSTDMQKAVVGLASALHDYRAAVGGSAEAPPEPEQKPARYLASVCETCRHAYNHHASTGGCEYVIRRAPENARYQGVPEIEACECSAFVDQPAEAPGVGQPVGDTTQPAAATTEAVELIADAVDADIAEWVEVRTGPTGFEADPRSLAELAVEALTARPDLLRALAEAGAPAHPDDDECPLCAAFNARPRPMCDLAEVLRVDAELPDTMPAMGAAAHCAYLRARKAIRTAIQVAAALAPTVPAQPDARPIHEGLRAAFDAGQAAVAAIPGEHLSELDQAAAWEPVLDALADLASVLEPPHDDVARAIVAALAGAADTEEPTPPVALPDRRPRLRACVEAWPECHTFGYDPRCCRFPKSCSCDCYDEERVALDALEDVAGAAAPQPPDGEH